jgi:hypothetical protein
MTLQRLFTLGLLVPAALGFSAAQAQADGETISITQDDPAAVVGHATNFSAKGTLNPDDTMFGFDIYIFEKDADADPTCAADFDTESASASHSGGNETWVSPPGGFQVGMGPSYDAPFKITFTGAGNYLLCGYVQGDFSTFASGELRGAVAPAPTTTTPGSTTPGSTTPGSTTPGSTNTTSGTVPAAAMPAVVRRPWITSKRHVLTCHAGTWSNAPTSRRYEWFVKGHSRRVASGSRLTVRRSLRGRKVDCRVTAANAAGRASASSQAVRAR